MNKFKYIFGKIVFIFCCFTTLLLFKTASAFGGQTIAVIYDQTNDTYGFAAAEIKRTLEIAGDTISLTDVKNIPGVTAQTRIVITVRGTIEAISFLNQAGITALPASGSQGYSIRNKVNGNNTDWYIIGFDKKGALYGALDLCRSIQLYGLTSLTNADKKPYIVNRGIKFNIPLDARTPGYSDNSDAAQKNIVNMWDTSFWHQFLDDMARDRFNMLSLWSLAPFPSMVNVQEYPNAGLNDVEKTSYPLKGFKSITGVNMSNANVLANLQLIKTISLADKIKFWQNVMAYADSRGIDCYLFTWNIFTYGTEGSGYGFTPAATDLKTIDYFRKATKALITTYPLLKGMGITAGENMSGKDASDENFLYQSYGMGINDALAADTNRKFRFIHRVHQTNVKAIKTAFSGLNPRCSFGYSFKYSQAHLYSSLSPDYIYKANFLTNIGTAKFFLTIRDDDWYYLRGGSDPAFARGYIKNIPYNNLSGFYLGPDGYTWGKEYINKDSALGNQLILDKRWYSFLLWGQLAYDPDLPDSLFKKILSVHFPRVSAQDLYDAWAKGSSIIPLVNRFHNVGCQSDYQWYPEACFSNGGFHDINKFISAGPQSGENLLSIPSYTSAILNNTPVKGVTPIKLAQTLHDIAAQTLALVSGISDTSTELRQTVEDISAMAYLGQYYSKKILGATFKCLSDKSSDSILKAQYKTSAIANLRDAAEAWRNYASQISNSYIPQWLTRMQQMVDIRAIQAKVDSDIVLAGGTINRIAVTDIFVMPASGTINVNDSLQLTDSINPYNATNKNIRWSSGNNNVVTVNANGMVTGISNGSAAITATTIDGYKSDTCFINVIDSNNAIRINSGGPAFMASGSRQFIADSYYSGVDHTSSIKNGDILNTTDDVIYRSERSSPSFSYNIPVKNGTLIVILHFAEIWFGVPGRGGSVGTGKRLFNVAIEGKRVLTDYDIFEKAGGAMTAHQETFQATVTDGVLNIDFLTGSAAIPKISAIEVIPIPPS